MLYQREHYRYKSVSPCGWRLKPPNGSVPPRPLECSSPVLSVRVWVGRCCIHRLTTFLSVPVQFLTHIQTLATFPIMSKSTFKKEKEKQVGCIQREEDFTDWMIYSIRVGETAMVQSTVDICGSGYCQPALVHPRRSTEEITLPFSPDWFHSPRAVVLSGTEMLRPSSERFWGSPHTAHVVRDHVAALVAAECFGKLWEIL